MDVDVLLFEGFESLDVFGPVEILGKVEGCALRYVSLHGGPVTGAQGANVLTQPLEKDGAGAVLLVPGGPGTRPLIDDAPFLDALRKAAARADWCLSVCTGSLLLARAGLLAGRKATTNKLAFQWVAEHTEGVDWQRRARWVKDDKYYTSSGVSAGMDMCLGFAADRLGAEKARQIAARIEYVWHADADDDPFAVE